MAVSIPSQTGWVSLAFPTSPNTMTGATAVIATTSASSGGGGVYMLASRSLSGVSKVAPGGARRLAQAASGISNVVVERSNGQTVASFTRAFDSSFTGAGPHNLLVASSGSNTLDTHSVKGGFQLELTDGGNAVSGQGEKTTIDKLRIAHGALGTAGWGVLIPLGVISATSLQSFGPTWFHLHRALNALGLLLGTAGIIIAWIKFDSLEEGGVAGSAGDVHKILGVVVIVLGWLQPINAFFRPKKPTTDPATGKPAKRGLLRVAWEVAHKGLGYLTLIFALVTILTGLHIIQEFNTVTSDTWRTAYIGVAIALALLWLAGLVFGLLMRRRKRHGASHAARASPESASPEGKHVERRSSGIVQS